MTDKDIITELEGIASERGGIFCYILDLVERLQAEKERLSGECKYWESEAKEARADLTENAHEAVRVFAERVKQTICENTHPDFNKEGKPVNVWNAKDGYRAIDNLCSKYGGADNG